MVKKKKTKVVPHDAPEFLKALVMAPGPSGFEDSAAACWRKYLEQYGLQVSTDTYGNSMTTINPGGQTSVMLVAHIDTIGLMVRHVDEDGLICVAEIGGLDPLALIGQHVMVMSDPPIDGVIGRRPVHLEEDDDEPPLIHDLRVDVGACDLSDIAELVTVGTPIIFSPQFKSFMGNRVCAPGMDDRIGAWCLAEAALRLLKSDKLKARVHMVASVQEETGLHGAHMAVEQLSPRLALGIDGTFAIDTPDLSKDKYGSVRLGGGPVIGIGGSSHPMMVRELLDTAHDKGIMVQREATPNSDGCVEADAIFRSCGGVLTGTLMVPMRYMHTSVEMVQLDDAEAVVDLAVAWCERVM